MQDTEEFDWFEVENDQEEDKIEEVIHKKAYFSRVFDFLSSTILYVFIIALFNHGFFIIFENERLPLVEIDLKNINLYILVFSGIFRLNILIFSLLAFLLNFVRAKRIMRYFDKLYRLIILVIFLFIIQMFLNIKLIGKEYNYVKRMVFSTNFSLIFYILFTSCVVFLEDKFVESTLKQKIANTEETEEILKFLKLYLNDFESESSCENEEEHRRFHDLFSFNISYQTILKLIQTDPGTEIENFNLKINKPVVRTIADAIELAKNIFNKVSSDNEKITYDEFKKMFKSLELAEYAYSFFDMNEDLTISKKEFRDTVLYFYKNRVALENSIEAVSHFTIIIKRVLYSIGFLILFVVDLILFGVNIKEIFALIVSLGIAANFVGNKMFEETWKSLIFLMSHQFDVGDRITLDNKEVKVYDIGLTVSSFILENGGKYKVLNSDLWKKPIINLTNAPEKIMLFTFDLPSNLTIKQIHDLKVHIKNFLKRKSFDFYDNFLLSSTVNNTYEIKKLNTTVTLKCKNYKSRSKKFLLRVEFTDYLNKYLDTNIN